MYSKKIGFIALAVLALFVLPACQRSASQAPLATPTLAGEDVTIPQPVDDNAGMGLIEQLATQTAMAAQAGAVATDPVTGLIIETATPDPLALPPVDVATEAPTPDPFLLPTPTPVMATSQQPVAAPGTYILQKGEFPYCIARRFNLNLNELLRLNNLSMAQATYLQVGYTLTLPQTGTPFDGARALLPHPASYTVQAGDSIYSIACKYGDVEPQAIASTNGLGAPYTLTAGSQLQIP